VSVNPRQGFLGDPGERRVRIASMQDPAVRAEIARIYRLLAELNLRLVRCQFSVDRM
jgi:hypothetical protein